MFHLPGSVINSGDLSPRSAGFEVTRNTPTILVMSSEARHSNYSCHVERSETSLELQMFHLPGSVKNSGDLSPRSAGFEVARNTPTILVMSSEAGHLWNCRYFICWVAS